MINPLPYISIGDYSYKGVVDVSCELSSETLTNTLTAVFPRKADWVGKSIKDLIKRGQKINVQLGYGDELFPRFEGYIKVVKADIPFTVQAEDTAFLLKKGSIKKDYDSVDLKTLLTDVIPKGITFEAKDIQLGKLRINNATPAEILANLKEKYGIYSYFKGTVLRSGIQYWGDGENHIFGFQQNILSGHNLEYYEEDEISYRVKAISIIDTDTEKNKRIEVENGDKDGELRTFHFYNIDKTELERRAKQELEKLKYTGYRGSFATFGVEAVNHGDTVTLKDKLYTEREGTYIVKSVKINFGMGGYRQTIEIDRLWS